MTAIRSEQLFVVHVVRLCIIFRPSHSFLQNQNTVSAYFTSKQILPFGFAELHWYERYAYCYTQTPICCLRPNIVIIRDLCGDPHDAK